MADELNFQVAAVGFGSYLDGIIPKDIAIAAGAFAATMQQIKNIENSDFEKFAQVVNNIETSKGLDLIGGTDVPVNLPLANQGQTLTALGSGPYGAYTHSDFFGCMSGLPYMWKDLQGSIQELTTTMLQNIYIELFLAVTWERAIVNIAQTKYNIEIQPYIPPTYDTDPLSPTYGNLLDPGQPRIDDWYYTVSATLAADGGGYGRGTAPAPLISFSPNNCVASATCTIGTNNQDASSMGGGSFGRVNSFSFNPGTAYLYTTTSVNSPSPPSPPAAPVEYVTIQSAPTASLPVQSNGERSTSGINTAGTQCGSDGSVTVLEAGWPGMNSVVQGYINQANQEIAYIKSRSPLKGKRNNVIYDACGLQLMREQRARYTGLPPVPIPRDVWLNLFPTALYVFTDSVPTLGLDTNPHMSAQTLEAISNLSTVGGQSVVGMMRESRNETRMVEIGVELDNQISGYPDKSVQNLLLVNGVVPLALSGISVQNINGNAANNVTTYTLPSILAQQDNTGNIIAPSTLGYIDPNVDKYIVTPVTVPYGQNTPIDNILATETFSPDGKNSLGPYGDGTGPIPSGGSANVGSTPSSGFNPIVVVVAGSSSPAGIGGSGALGGVNTGLVPLVNALLGSGLNGSVLDTGQTVVPGSFAGSKFQNLLPNTLNTTYSSGTTLPATYSVTEAIEQVILCNCDCWVN